MAAGGHGYWAIQQEGDTYNTTTFLPRILLSQGGESSAKNCESSIKQERL